MRGLGKFNNTLRVRIGQGAVVGAGSVVTKSVEPYSLYAGVPARKIRDLSRHPKIYNAGVIITNMAAEK